MSGWIGYSVPPGGEEALRRALLQRIADRLAFAHAIEAGEDAASLRPAPDWDCCWVRFEWSTRPPYQYPAHRYVHQLCRGRGAGYGCHHWHHYSEVLIA